MIDTDTLTVMLEIENVYEDDDPVTTTVTTEIPAPWCPTCSATLDPVPADREKRYCSSCDDWKDIDEWEDEVIFPLTGSGHEDGDAAYFVKVKVSSQPELLAVGTEFEFGL